MRQAGNHSRRPPKPIGQAISPHAKRRRTSTALSWTLNRRRALIAMQQDKPDPWWRLMHSLPPVIRSAANGVNLTPVTAMMTLMVIAGGTQSHSEQLPLLTSQLGQNYAEVRENLISHGFHPIDQTAAPGRFCLGRMATICARYQEAASCAVDASTPWRFEWATATKRRFHIVTHGCTLQSLSVASYQTN